MRTTYIVSYDVADDKRLRRVFKICKNYGVHLQFSVFECDLSASELEEMTTDLSAALNHGEDQVLLIELGPTESRGERRITSLGLPYAKFDSPCYVV